MSPQQKREDVKTKLLGLWERREEFGRPIGCLATTYTFDAGFFEGECLTRFAGIDGDPTEDLAAYVVEREEKLSEVFACVLVDQGHVSPQRSLRWNLLPIRIPGGGIQHAKVSLLAWERHIRLLVGSANLTVPGFGQNFENIGVLDFTPEGDAPISLLKEVLSFTDTLRSWVPGGQGVAEAGPRLALARFLDLLRSMTASWVVRPWERDEPQVFFIAVVPEGPSLFAHVSDRVWTGTRPDVAWVLSPFFDHGDGARFTVQSLVEIMGRNGVRSLHFMGQGTRLLNGDIDLDLPAVLRDEWLLRVRHRFALVHERDGEGNMRRLHAKSLWLERDDHAVYVIGSSNFTARGTGVAKQGANVEANLAYRLPSGRSAFADRCEASYPPYEEIELSDAVRFTQAIDEETAEPEEFVALPLGFGEALYEPDDPHGTLHLHIATNAPPVFAVRTEAGDLLLTGERWREEENPGITRVQWPYPRPPSAVKVEWSSPDGSQRRSWWIVNVTDASRLPPPEELRDLPLQVLLEILSSARPLHEALARATRQRSREGPTLGDLDPHRRVDTSQYLLKRVERVSRGTEGLRTRLGRPAFSLDALRWRLEGPVGPLALARRLSQDEPRAAAFLIAELARVVRQVEWATLMTALGSDTVSAEVDKCVRELKELAGTHPSALAVARYVADTFEATRA